MEQLKEFVMKYFKIIVVVLSFSLTRSDGNVIFNVIVPQNPVKDGEAET